tara:strand:- start:694 stop:2673 length:1980 start_codon:yes stop_codon:yes gene_type:complete
MKEKKEDNLFIKLTKLFRNGPAVKKKVKAYKEKKSSPSSLEVFRRAHSDVYNSTLSAYGSYDRMARYSDFSEMESTPEISSALDIYAEETVAPDANGCVLHIYSENRVIKELLENLFYDVLNVDFNLVMWVRNLCKYGDFFLFNDISPEYGVTNVFPIPIAEMEREEGYDSQNPTAVRFRWVTQGNRVLENWQVSHFRLLGNDAFLPYGSSVLEGARRIWRQLILIEDAMLVYRVIRSPERRVFYIDVGNIPPENVADYLQQAQSSLKRNSVVDKSTGQVDLRYNPLSVDEDYFLPVRGGESGTKIDTLAGGTNVSAIEDVEYIQKKLFSALKIPKAYLGYDEDIGSKATLAQEDIRFSRTILRIQKTIIAELNKIAMIHLYSHGYSDEDLMDFELKLSNPSSIAQQQKLELIRTKFEIASLAPETLVDRAWVSKNILDLNKDDVDNIKLGRKKDKLEDMKLELVVPPEFEKKEGLDFDNKPTPGSAEDILGSSSPSEDSSSSTPETDSSLSNLFAGDQIPDDNILEEDDGLMSVGGTPIKPSKYVKKRTATGNKWIKKDELGTSLTNPASKKARGKYSLYGANDKFSFENTLPQSPVIEEFIDKQISKLGYTSQLKNSLEDMNTKLNLNKNKKVVLTEETDSSDDILNDILNEEIDND